MLVMGFKLWQEIFVCPQLIVLEIFEKHFSKKLASSGCMNQIEDFMQHYEDTNYKK